jgi:hypothetical protein
MLKKLSIDNIQPSLPSTSEAFLIDDLKVVNLSLYARGIDLNV